MLKWNIDNKFFLAIEIAPIMWTVGLYFDMNLYVTIIMVIEMWVIWSCSYIVT